MRFRTANAILPSAPPVAQHLRLASPHLLGGQHRKKSRCLAVLQINIRAYELEAAPSNVVIYIFHLIAMQSSTLKITSVKRFSH
jgi:hypothetical protein